MSNFKDILPNSRNEARRAQEEALARFFGQGGTVQMLKSKAEVEEEREQNRARKAAEKAEKEARKAARAMKKELA